MQLPQPTEHHKRILEGVGEWEGTMTLSMPGMPTTPTPALQSVEAVGPFWTQCRFTCQFMGAEYIGTGILGYDPAKKKHIGTWSDSASTEIALMEGDYDAKSNMLTMRWTSNDKTTGERVSTRYECVTTRDTYTSTFYRGEGKGQQTMVISLRRKGSKTKSS